MNFPGFFQMVAIAEPEQRPNIHEQPPSARP
jgi:hypothetical protein